MQMRTGAVTYPLGCHEARLFNSIICLIKSQQAHLCIIAALVMANIIYCTVQLVNSAAPLIDKQRNRYYFTRAVNLPLSKKPFQAFIASVYVGNNCSYVVTGVNERNDHTC